MRVFIAYMMLFFYAVTCTGASVYVHQCNGETVLIKQVSNTEMPGSCPLCAKSHKDTKTCNTSSGNDCKKNCCKDIQVDLKKGDQDAENAPSVAPFLSFSPATLTLHWIITFWAESYETTPLPLPEDKEFFANGNPPPYLVLCNFRI